MFKRSVSYASSLRTTALLFAVLLAILLLRVALPQEIIVGKEAISRIASRGPVYHLFFDTLGLSDVTSSPVFLVAAALFYINLVLVLIKYMKATVTRIRYVPSAYSGWQSAALKIERASAEDKLTKFSFELKEIGGGTAWGVRNRYSPLGFMLFHFSFFLFLAGGTLLYATRYTAQVDLMKDSSFEFKSDKVRILRKPAMMPAANSFLVTLDSVESERRNGAPIKLKTGLSFASFDMVKELSAEVNNPARFRGFSFLPLIKDRALIFTSYDSGGRETGKHVILTELEAGKELTAKIDDEVFLKIPYDGHSFEVASGGGTVSAMLEPGRRAEFAGGVLVLSGSTEWVSFLVVYERGPAFLITGFVLAILGLSIRFLFPRQDVVMDGERIYFKGEYFPLALRRLLYEIGADDDSF